MKKLLLLAGGGFLVCLGLCSVVVLGVMRAALKDSWAYARGLERALADEQVRAALGAPVSAGWLVMGKLESSSRGGSHASLAIPLEGSRQRGTLAIEAHTTAVEWQFDRLEVRVEGASHIDLIGEEN